MYIYAGKLNWFQYAKNELITVVIPGGLALNDPISAFWQWTVDSSGNRKKNTCQQGIIDSVTKTPSNEYRIGFSFGYYKFDGTVSRDFSSLTVIMRNPKGDRDSSGPAALRLQLSDSVAVPSAVVYTGKLNWLQYAVGEMVILVVPEGVANGARVGMYFEWTVTAAGNKKENCTVNSTFRNVGPDHDGEISGTFGSGYYTFDVTIKQSTQSCLLSMTNPSGYRDPQSPYHLKQTDFRSSRTKKALIVRFGTGTDNGIFLAQDMLTQHLAFHQNDIEMLYYDSEPPSGPNTRMSGQNSPTASNFRAKFTTLVSSTSPGDVRLLYVDARGNADGNDGHSGEANYKDEGWILARSEDGIRKEVIYYDWVADTIRNNLGPDVNLTILTSSRVGSGMLDTRTPIPGILLAGCFEAQFNVKALIGLDPWIYAITNVIKDRFRRKSGVPSYSTLYNEVNRFIKSQIAEEQARRKHKGPETVPFPRDRPQLIFYGDYIDPDVERFLYPVLAPRGGEVRGEVTRYPASREGQSPYDHPVQEVPSDGQREQHKPTDSDRETTSGVEQSSSTPKNGTSPVQLPCPTDRPDDNSPFSTVRVRLKNPGRDRILVEFFDADLQKMLPDLCLPNNFVVIKHFKFNAPVNFVFTCGPSTKYYSRTFTTEQDIDVDFIVRNT